MKRNDIVVEVDELKTLLSDSNLRLFDASVMFRPRGSMESAEKEYLSGHIPGAAFLDHLELSDRNSDYMFMALPADTLAEAIGAHGIGHDHQVVVYARETIMWATRAFWVLRYAGHNNVRILNGGLKAWQDAGGTLETERNTYAATRFEPAIRETMLATKDEVEAAMLSERTCTVNALPFDYYTGDTDVPYAKDGHITGSISHPYDELLDDEHRLLSNPALSERLAKKLSSDKIITYCGGGIAATVNAVACLLTGREDVAVYDGSMSEWRGTGMPMTRGESPR